MKKGIIILIGFFVFVSCKSLLPTKILPFSMVEYQPEKFIDETEITVEQWAEFVFSGNLSHKPDSTITNHFRYHDLFYPKAATDSLFRAFGKLNYFNLPVQKTYFDTLNYNELRAILDTPITGITYNDALAYCQWRTEQYNKNHTSHTKQRIRFTLPDSVIVQPLQQAYQLNKHERLVPIVNRGDLDYERKKDAPNKIVATQISQQPIVVNAMPPNEYGVYGLYGNVAEMSAQKGFAYGGSYRTTGTAFLNRIPYNSAESWLGFRCVGLVY